MKAIDYLCIIVLWKYALPRRLVYNFGYLNFNLARVADLPLPLIICRHISILVSAVISGMATIKIKSWKTQWSIYSYFFSPLLRKHFSGYSLAGQKRKKSVFFCDVWPIRRNDHASGSQRHVSRKRRQKSISSGKPIFLQFWEEAGPDDTFWLFYGI